MNHRSTELNGALAAVLRTNDDNFKPLLHVMFRSEEFYASSVVCNQVKSPVQWLVGTSRILECELPPAVVCWGLLRSLGQDLFTPPNVKGWDGGLSWITTNTLLARYNDAAVLVQGTMESLTADDFARRPGGPGGEKIEKAVQRIHVGGVNAEKILTPDERANTDTLVAALEHRLLQSRFKGDQEKALREFLEFKSEIGQYRPSSSHPAGNGHAAISGHMKNEITLQTRREFLRSTVLGSALSWTVPTFLADTFAVLQAGAADSATQIATGKDATILVVLQMAGGNDGLNTLVPFANDDYHRARPKLGFSAEQVLKLNDQLGFHSALTGFKDLYDAGHLAVMQGVGYPNPNRSHFRSTEIWQTASDSDKVEKYGWLGRYFDNCCSGADPMMGVTIGSQLPQAFFAKTPTGICFNNPQTYRFHPAVVTGRTAGTWLRRLMKK